MSEPADAILIKEELIRAGVGEDVATEAKHVFYSVRRLQSPRSSFVIVERFGASESNPQKLASIAANVSDCLRVLEEHDFIRFKGGRYTLTEKGKRVR